MRQIYDKRRKLMVELMREVGFGIPVMPDGAAAGGEVQLRVERAERQRRRSR